ncbi:Retrovirus-related Pol polyprotein [Penicillium sp. DV-2018c]|nr:Retrovirus-related Pol polyprotein [Penicillium sp. DV-2018c]KAJ5571653.1 Retrovirus-related Pol polyprotein [Penicillium sp. DV-2018c]
MSPGVDDFAEEFAGMAMSSLVDLFSGYDQITLHYQDRDVTAIQAPIGLLRQTTILQGGSMSFLDDLAVKGPRSKYGGAFAEFGIRRYVLEHLQNLDKTLYLLELAGAIVSAEKSQFMMSGMEIVGWICHLNGRRPEEAKVAKVIEWPVPQNKIELRSFVGLAVYFLILIEKFQVIMKPLYLALRKDTHFEWGPAHQTAFDEIKQRLSTFPSVLPIDYDFVENCGSFMYIR